MSISYAKTREGDWAVIGPQDAIRAGAIVTVHTRSGRVKTERIRAVSRPFSGKRFGYIDPGYHRPVTDEDWDDDGDWCSTCGCAGCCGCDWH